MELGVPLSLAEILRAYQAQKEINPPGSIQGLFPYEGESSLNIQSALSLTASMAQRNGQQFWIFVGSEGGFSTAEVELFQEFSLAPTTLGPQVLRVETACLALVTIIRYVLGQFA